jgi:hypothetical protein
MPRLATALPLLALLSFACSSPAAPTEITLLNTTLTMTQGVTCENGGVSADFMGTAGTTVVISGSGTAAQTPRFTLYAPDFATQLGGSSSSGAGAASLTIGLAQTGVHHVTFCDVNGVGGTLRAMVKQQT